MDKTEIQKKKKNEKRTRKWKGKENIKIKEYWIRRGDDGICCRESWKNESKWGKNDKKKNLRIEYGIQRKKWMKENEN